MPLMHIIADCNGEAQLASRCVWTNSALRRSAWVRDYIHVTTSKCYFIHNETRTIYQGKLEF